MKLPTHHHKNITDHQKRKKLIKEIWLRIIHSDSVLPIVLVIGILIYVTISCILYMALHYHNGIISQATHHHTSSSSSSSRLDSLMMNQQLLSSSSSSSKEHFRYNYEQEHLELLDTRFTDSVVENIRNDQFTFPNIPNNNNNNNMTYSIFSCPSTPPPNYPFQWKVLDILYNWNPDDVETIPSTLYSSLCIFDWNLPHHRPIMETYRDAEVPFIIYNHPQIWQTAGRWSFSTDYLSKLLKGNVFRTEYAKQSNHLMYWKTKGLDELPKDWVAPTQNIEMTFQQWYQAAMDMEDLLLQNPTNDNNNNNDAIQQQNLDHYYLRVNGEYNFQSNHLSAADTDIRNTFLYKELPIFDPTRKSFFMVNPTEQRGINCRFGMKGSIAETHYDFSRNFILLLGGQKRYILSHPSQCPNLGLYPKGHPSARHSYINWSDPDSANKDNKNFRNAMGLEVVLQAGDALYLPTGWFHFIVSLNMNYQCNARSGTTYENIQHLRDCGFQ